MARIGNWLSTWEREIRENDFTSGVFAYAIDTDVITVDDLTKEDKFKIVNKIKKVQIEKKLLKEWEDNYLLIKKLGKKILAKKIQGFNLNKSLQKLEKFIIFHLTSKGYK